jgi:hypothetical protein
VRPFKKQAHSPIILVNLKGGLGNQLFQLANAVSLAIEFNRSIKLLDTSYLYDAKRKYLLDFWGLCQNTIYKVDIDSLGRLVFKEERIKCNCEPEIFEETDFFYSRIDLASLGNKCLKIDGYWQSEKYFQAIKYEFVNFLNAKLTKGNTRPNSILMHVRLGDFISEKATVIEHGILGNTYYLKALSTVSGLNAIEIVSDEPLRVMDYLGQEFCEKFGVKVIDSKSEFETFRDFKNYQTLILANSTFSWWGAYLAEAHNVIAPRAVFSEAGLRKRNVCDFYPNSWILV